MCATQTIKALADQCLSALNGQIAANNLPHRLEREAIIVHWNPIHEGTIRPQPPEIVPSYCIIKPEPKLLLSVDLSIEKRNEHTERVRDAFKPWFETAGTDDVFEGMKSLMREAVIDGMQCSVLPFCPIQGKSIPRKSVASKAFKPYGFKPIGKANKGSLSFVKALGGESDLIIDFDFGTWRRTVIASCRLVRHHENDGPIVHNLLRRLPYWGEEMDMPLLDEYLFRLTMENAAFAANCVGEEVNRNIDSLVPRENNPRPSDD
jgi:hypothetical protein